MNAQEISRQRIAIFGRVTVAQTKQALAGVQVRITVKPEAFADLLALKATQYGTEWRIMARRPDRTLTADDGSFYFMDLPLPEGNYTLSASLPVAGNRYATTDKKIKLTRDAEGKIKTASIDINLAATSITGCIIENKKSKKPIAMARILVPGSGECVYSNKEGKFLLTGIEPVKSGKKKGIRTIQVTAPGYRAVSMETRGLTEAGSVEDLKNIEMPL